MAEAVEEAEAVAVAVHNASTSRSQGTWLALHRL